MWKLELEKAYDNELIFYMSRRMGLAWGVQLDPGKQVFSSIHHPHKQNTQKFSPVFLFLDIETQFLPLSLLSRWKFSVSRTV